jgi:hypothetical protein
MSLRNFTRALKIATIKTDDDLLEFVKGYAPKTNKKTGTRALEEFVGSHINNDSNFKTLTELFGVINKLIPSIVSWTLAKDLFYQLRMTVVEKYGKDSPEHKKTFEKMRLPKAVYDQQREEYTRQVVAKNNDKKQFDGAVIKSIVLLIAQQTDLIDKLILLQLSCGARIGELIYSSDFKDARNKNTVRQSGILKTKHIDLVVDKPILYMGKASFLQLFRAVRAELKITGNDTKDGGTKLNSTINARVKHLFKDDSMISHDLRRLYANIAYNIFANTKKTSECAYIASILGHDPLDIGTSKSYTTLHVNNVDKLLGVLVRDDSPVSMINNDNDDTAVPVNPKKRDGRVLEYLKRTTDAMSLKGEKITERNLKKYGYSSPTYLLYKNAV